MRLKKIIRYSLNRKYRHVLMLRLSSGFMLISGLFAIPSTQNPVDLLLVILMAWGMAFLANILRDATTMQRHGKIKLMIICRQIRIESRKLQSAFTDLVMERRLQRESRGIGIKDPATGVEMTFPLLNENQDK